MGVVLLEGAALVDKMNGRRPEASHIKLANGHLHMGVIAQSTCALSHKKERYMETGDSNFLNNLHSDLDQDKNDGSIVPTLTLPSAHSLSQLHREKRPMSEA